MSELPFRFYADLPIFRPRGYIVCHTSNRELLKSLIGTQSPSVTDAIKLGAFEIRPSPYAPRFTKKYRFPQERFVEYEESDRAWCEPLGIGRLEETNEPYFAVINPAALTLTCFS